MAKTYKGIFDHALTFSKLLEAHLRARKGKRFREEVIRFEMDLEGNLTALARKLKNGTYRLQGYREFTIYEPKERLIRAAPYCDRVIHQWYVINFIKPIFGKTFIYDSYACLEGKGMHRATDRVQEFLRRMEEKWPAPYIVKGDIKKYFFSIDHEILNVLIKKKIADPKVLWLTRIILDSVDNPGVPVGSYTSQFFANVYLHQLDIFVKHQLRIKNYVRYMDDFILVVENKEAARQLLQQIREFLAKNLKLELNGKTQIFPVKNGVNFCGYKIKSTHLKIRTESKRLIKRKLRKFKVKFKAGEMRAEDIRTVLVSWIGYARKANSYHLIKKILNQFTF
ncbi:MAG: RNA-dependent DNA polymerase [Peptococcaceae bacterium]|nr:RNA-dependent DNA polymerase [Peptococcaceae bacterium]